MQGDKYINLMMMMMMMIGLIDCQLKVHNLQYYTVLLWKRVTSLNHVIGVSCLCYHVTAEKCMDWKPLCQLSF